VRSVEFHPEAEAELVSAAQYFESHVENLGLDFILAVRRAYERILDFPDSSRELRAEGAGSPEQLGQLRGHVCFLRSPERGGDEAVRTYQGRRPDNSPGHRVRVSPPRRDIVRGQLSGVSAGDQVFGGDSSRALGEKIQWATACAVTCWFA
jgi:hypothetical protein